MPLAPDSVLAALLDLVLPAECAGCGRPRAPLCEGCATRLFAELAVSGPPSRHTPVPAPDGFPPTVAGGVHHGLLAALVVAFKDGERADLAHVLGPVLAGGIAVAARGAPQAVPESWIAVVPVPSARAAFRRRGRRPTLELARAAVSVLGPRAGVVEVLSQVRAPRDQAGLGRDARLRNLTGTMALRRGGGAGSSRLGGAATLVVVDDVVTSGATLTEAARALSPLGLPVVAAVVGARRRGARADR
jgi:predicted amidophosphoribosyltransferase